MSKRYLKGLTARQGKIVLHGCSGASVSPAKLLLVVAGAGTGKTKTLAAFAAHRLRLAVDPNRILILAFNRAASRQIQSRVRAMVGSAACNLPPCGTFHATGLGFIRRYASHLGLEQNVTIQDRSDSARLMQKVICEQKSARRRGFPDIDKCLAIYSVRVNTFSSLDEILARRFLEFRGFERELQDLLQAYDQAKRATNVVDFDDLLALWDRLLDNKKIAERIRGLFDYVLVDEYQDTSALQNQILRRLRPDGRGVVLVGDDDQCIYGFLGTTPENISSRARIAKVAKLTRNWRSTQQILDVCNVVIDSAERRMNKALWSKSAKGAKPRLQVVSDEAAQVCHVIGRINQAQAEGVPLREQAVLARTGEETEQLEAELKRVGIPYRKAGGHHFFDQPSVKAALAILTWCENPRDEVAGELALQTVVGIDAATATRVTASLKGRLSRKRILSRRPPHASQQKWAAFADLIRRLQDLPWNKQVSAVCHWLREGHLENALSPKATQRLSKRAGEHSSRTDFLAAAKLETAGGELGSPTKTDRLTVSTIHSAKGQEWTAVYILNAVDGCIPSRRSASREAVEEERRLLFVAMTRAKQQLELIVPKRLRRLGNNGCVGLARTRFISKRMLHLFELNQRGHSQPQ